MATVVKIAQLLEPSRFEAVGFIDYDQIGWSRTPLRVGMPYYRATSQSKDSPPEASDVTLDDARGVDYPRRVQDRPPRPAVRWGYPIMTMRRRSQYGFKFVPACVLTRGRRLSNARHAITQADIASLPSGVAELHKATVFPGNDELGRSGRLLGGSHSSLK